MKWLRVNRRNRCPICEHPDWCGYSDDGRLALCMRVPSDRAARNGGYVHRLTDDKPHYARPVPVRKSSPPPQTVAFDSLLSSWSSKTTPDALCGLTMSLGVSEIVLRALRATWASPHNAWAFPMRDDEGKVVGIRLRAENGRKWAVRGSKEGLFYPERTPVDHVAVICEGPTDTAAALSLGLWAVGRPSCMGAEDHVKRLCRRLLITHLVVMADNDQPKRRPGGGWWQPGIEGARRLVEAVRLPYKILAPPAKDIRAFVQAGATIDDFNELEQQQSWRF